MPPFQTVRRPVDDGFPSGDYDSGSCDACHPSDAASPMPSPGSACVEPSPYTSIDEFMGVMKRPPESQRSLVCQDGTYGQDDTPSETWGSGRSRVGGFAVALGLAFGQAVAVEQSVQRAAADAQQARRVFLVASGGFEHGQDMVAPQRVQRARQAAGASGGAVAFAKNLRRQVFDRQDRVGRQGHRPLDHMLELAHVAGPWIFDQRLQRVLRERRTGCSLTWAVTGEKKLYEQGDVLRSLPERRQDNRHGVEAVQ